jgi:flagellar biosynthesis protein FlhF
VVSGAELPLQLRAYREELLAIGVDPVVVERWIGATVSFAANLGDAQADGFVSGTPWLEHLQRSVERELRIGSPIRTHPGDRRVVALVGPTGVGKTTTVAKLAAGFRIEARRRVGMLTIDTFRIAAVQQLKAYAEIMDLPMEVVENPDQMRPALDRLGDVDLVLIDTAGRSPRSDARIEQLVELLRSAQPDETHLVLSATSSASVIRTALDGFAPVRPTSTILTKLDEAPHTAAVLSAIAASDQFPGVPVSYITNGQQVPDDIAMADAEPLLSRLLPARVTASQMEAA